MARGNEGGAQGIPPWEAPGRGAWLFTSVFKRSMLGMITITPLIGIYLILLDALQIINALVVTPLVYIFSCGRWHPHYFESCINLLFERMFGMTMIDVAGFRRCRTIC